MVNSGDAAEQVVRLSMEGMEMALKLTGSAAKEIAVFLFAAIKNKEKNPRGHKRIKAMLKSGKATKIFSIGSSDLKRFASEAKRYGLTYCVLKNSKEQNGKSEIMVFQDNANSVNRIIENLGIASVDRASIENDIIKTKREVKQEKKIARKHFKVDKKAAAKLSRAKFFEELGSSWKKSREIKAENVRIAKIEYDNKLGRTPSADTKVGKSRNPFKRLFQRREMDFKENNAVSKNNIIPEPEIGVEEKSKTDTFLDELFSKPETANKEKNAPENPSAARAEKNDRQSGRSSTASREQEIADISQTNSKKRPSVKEDLKKISADKQIEKKKEASKVVEHKPIKVRKREKSNNKAR